MSNSNGNGSAPVRVSLETKKEIEKQQEISSNKISQRAVVGKLMRFYKQHHQSKEQLFKEEVIPEAKRSIREILHSFNGDDKDTYLFEQLAEHALMIVSDAAMRYLSAEEITKKLINIRQKDSKHPEMIDYRKQQEQADKEMERIGAT